LNEPEYNEYLDDTALRQAVERKARRSLSDDEWTVISPDWSAPYGDGDVAQMLQDLRNFLPPKAKRSPEDSARLARRADAERIALEARSLVEDLRQELFGQKHPPPFPTRATWRLNGLKNRPGCRSSRPRASTLG
jgi:hypothetical protein